MGRLTSRESPLVPPELLCRLLRYDWPLNVRQLRAAAEWLWTFNRHALERNPDAQVEFGGTRAMPAPEAFCETPSPGRDEGVSCGGPERPSKGLVDLDRAEIESLFEERWEERDPGRSLAATVDRLQMKHGIVVSVGQLRRELQRREILREAGDTVSAEALRAAWTECGGDVTAAARKLGLTAQGLGDELRMQGIAKVARYRRMAK